MSKQIDFVLVFKVLCNVVQIMTYNDTRGKVVYIIHKRGVMLNDTYDKVTSVLLYFANPFVNLIVIN